MFKVRRRIHRRRNKHIVVHLLVDRLVRVVHHEKVLEHAAQQFVRHLQFFARLARIHFRRYHGNPSSFRRDLQLCRLYAHINVRLVSRLFRRQNDLRRVRVVGALHWMVQDAQPTRHRACLLHLLALQKIRRIANELLARGRALVLHFDASHLSLAIVLDLLNVSAQHVHAAMHRSQARKAFRQPAQAPHRINVRRLLKARQRPRIHLQARNAVQRA
mmetsp:Transcript_31058/g.50380  ORF Transcript_31058/g.50380 Transcript_31058/m.50380 type:complete len:217 (+) Transcript_31058:1560-2210(+)